MCPRASGHCDMGLPARMINLEVASGLAARGGGPSTGSSPAKDVSRATPLPPELTANQGGRGTVAVARVQADHQDSLKGSRRERRADGDGPASDGERLYIGGDLRFVHTVCVDGVDPLVVVSADII